MKNILKVLYYAASFVIVGAVALFLVYRLVDFDNTGEVPLIKGLSVTEASEMLNKRKLFLNIQGRKHDPVIPEGNILSQGPDAGKKIPAGTPVNVIVSMGREIYSMPSFEGQRLKDAKLTLRNLGIRVKKTTSVHSAKAAKGEIIAQRPLPGNSTGNEINFLVSLGPDELEYSCPDFVSMEPGEARVLADALAITLSVRDKGARIISQEPHAGALIHSGDTIKVRLGSSWKMWF